MKKFLSTSISDLRVDLALLLFRVILSISLIGTHGLKNIIHFDAASRELPDPFGMGPLFSVVMAILSDVVCALLVLVGCITRFAILPILMLTLTGLFVVHIKDSAVIRDVPLIYSLSFLLLFYLGPGKYSVDQILFSK